MVRFHQFRGPNRPLPLSSFSAAKLKKPLTVTRATCKIERSCWNKTKLCDFVWEWAPAELSCCCQHKAATPRGPLEAYTSPADHAIRSCATDRTLPGPRGRTRRIDPTSQTPGGDLGDDPVGPLRPR